MTLNKWAKDDARVVHAGSNVNYDEMQWNFGNVLNVESIGYNYTLDFKCERAFKDISKVLELSKVEDGVVS